MSNLETELSDLGGSTCFGSFQFCNAYWQISLHPSSYKTLTSFQWKACSPYEGPTWLKNAIGHF